MKRVIINFFKASMLMMCAILVIISEYEEIIKEQFLEGILSKRPSLLNSVLLLKLGQTKNSTQIK